MTMVAETASIIISGQPNHTKRLITTFPLFAKAFLAVARHKIFFKCLNPTPPAVHNPNYWGIVCNPNYWGGKLKAASWVAAKGTRQPTRLPRGFKPRTTIANRCPPYHRNHSASTYRTAFVFTNI